jgi:hypothetical protein
MKPETYSAASRNVFVGAPPVVVTVPPGRFFSIIAERWPKKKPVRSRFLRPGPLRFQ